MGIVKTDSNRTLVAASMVGLGLVLLFGLGNFWALFILLPGLAFLRAYDSGHEAAAPMAIPGMLITGTGAIFLLQSLTGFWESWAFAWTLYGVFLGSGLVMMGKRINDDTLIKVGRAFTIAGGGAFFILGSLYMALASPLIKYVIVIGLFAAAIQLMRSPSSKRKVKRTYV